LDHQEPKAHLDQQANLAKQVKLEPKEPGVPKGTQDWRVSRVHRAKEVPKELRVSEGFLVKACQDTMDTKALEVCQATRQNPKMAWQGLEDPVGSQGQWAHLAWPGMQECLVSVRHETAAFTHRSCAKSRAW